MNEEIKEILDSVKLEVNSTKSWIEPVGLNRETWNKLLDYITNLQQENERLKETNVYCNRTDCIGRIKDSRKYDSVYQEKEYYKSRCEKAIEYIDNSDILDIHHKNRHDLLNILQNGGDSQ